MAITIAIDGPMGAGKSTIARDLAAALSVLYLDTGAMYRAAALSVLRAGISPEDQALVEAHVEPIHIEARPGEAGQKTYLSGEDVSELIRTPEVSQATSKISMYPKVREKMVALQRECAAGQDMVLEGRDIGTRVLPDAAYKFYLDAPPEVRAARRQAERLAKGEESDYEAVLKELMERDERDKTRTLDPLTKAQDAIVIETGHVSQSEVVSLLESIVREEAR